MKTSHVVVAGVAVIAGAIIGAAGGYYYARHRFVAAVEQLTAGLATPVKASPTRSDRASAPTDDVRKTAWDVGNHTDAISGFTSWYVSGLSREAQTAMIVRCGLAPGSLDLSVFSDQMRPDYSAASGGDEYFVSYRFDDKPGVSLQQWFGSGNSTSPYPTVEDSFLRSLAQSRSLIMRIGSTVMDGMNAQLPDQHFDLAGYDDAIAKLKPHCTGIKAQTAKH